MMVRRFSPLLIVLTLAALIGAAFLFPDFRLDPREKLFAVTGEERLAAQVRGAFQWALRWTRPLPDTADHVPVANKDLHPFGVNTFLEQEVEPEKRARSLAMIADAGFSSIRQSFPWYDIEIHGKGDFEDRRHDPPRSAWEKYDHIVDLAGNYDLAIIARLEHPPAWSREAGTEKGAFAPPDDLDDFGDYVATVVSRYRGRIRFYQIWNEPNIYPEWGHQPVDPEGYTEMLCLAYERVKEADPQAVVISGALAPTAELGTWNPSYEGNNLMDVIFLQRMYDAGAGDCFDVMAVNNYMLFSGPTDRRLEPTPDQVNFSRPLWVRDVMVANGDAGTPIWISEMNSNAAPEGVEARFGRMTLEQQARYAPLALDRIRREWPWAGVTSVWFFKRATDTERDQPFYHFRLVEPDFTPMPVFETLSTYLNDLEPTLYAGRHQESSWQLTYEGEWQERRTPHAELGAYRTTRAPGASLTVSWEGRRLRLDPGTAEGRIRIEDASGHRREVTLTGEAVDLTATLLPRVHRWTLTAVEGEFAVDALEVH